MRQNSGWNPLKSRYTNTQPVHKHLNNKYDTQFNFFLTKNTNQIIYNHVLSPNFIEFKDQIIFADNNQYLKRYYFLKNAMDKEEIFDRINLLAQFYGNAVLLRYQYPLMILTKTKSIFLKRLKRMKKYLVQEGSSDDSNSHKNDEAVSINSSRFLRTISSSELQRKSLDQINNFQLDFSLFKQDQQQIHDTFAPQIDEQQTQNNIFLANITKFTRQLACELVLQKQQNEQEINHLVVDFQQFDKEDVIKKYQKIVEKQNRSINSGKQSSSRKQSLRGSKHLPMQGYKIRQLMEKKPMASSITITALQDQQHPPTFSSPLQQNDYLKKKSMMSPRYSQHQNIQAQKSPPVKRSTFYQYQLQHKNFPLSNELVINEDQMEDSPHKIFTKHQKSPSFSPRQEVYQHEKEIRTSRNYGGQGKREPRVKYSSILNKDPRYKPIHTQPDQSQMIRPFSFRENDLGSKQQYPMYDRFDSPMSPQNRMTSINININNLEEKKEEHKINVKYHPKKSNFHHEGNREEDRQLRAQKKKKIRQKAAALLNRVKSQEYFRPFHQYQGEYNSPPHFYERYYH